MTNYDYNNWLELQRLTTAVEKASEKYIWWVRIKTGALIGIAVGLNAIAVYDLWRGRRDRKKQNS